MELKAPWNHISSRSFLLPEKNKGKINKGPQNFKSKRLFRYLTPTIMLWCFAARPSLDFGYDNSWLGLSAFDYVVFVDCQYFHKFHKSLSRNSPDKHIAGHLLK